MGHGMWTMVRGHGMVNGRGHGGRGPWVGGAMVGEPYKGVSHVRGGPWNEWGIAFGYGRGLG